MKIMYQKKMVYLIIGVCFVSILYLFTNSYFNQPQLFQYVCSLRLPTLIVMFLSAFAIGSASMVFQSIISNRMVTPCLLGMNSMYTFLHTAIIFLFGSSSIFATNSYLSFLIDLIVMSIFATFIYSYLFKKTRNNMLYVLLIGSVLASFFGSMQSTMIRVMDPNEYDSLLTTLVADFNHVKVELIFISVVLMIGIILFLWKDLQLLDVITLGKNQAINLGVDYHRSVSRLLLGVVLYIAIATALVGPISFLGLIIANLARQFFQTYQHRYLILGSACMGMIAMIFAQYISQHIFHYVVPMSTFITIGGGIYFLYLLLSTKGGS